MKSNDAIIEINIKKSILKKIKDDNVREFAKKNGAIKN